MMAAEKDVELRRVLRKVCQVRPPKEDSARRGSGVVTTIRFCAQTEEQRHMKLAIAVVVLCALFRMEPVEANTFCLTVNRVATNSGPAVLLE